jgi:hypothetical protein
VQVLPPVPLQAAQAAGEGPHRPALWLLMHTNTSSAQHHWKPSSATFPGAGGCRFKLEPAGVAQKDLSGNSMDHSGDSPPRRPVHQLRTTHHAALATC